MSLVEPARADAQERDAVAVPRVHVRLDLEDEAGEVRSSVGSTSRRVAQRAAPGGGASVDAARRGTARRRSSSSRCRRTPASAAPARYASRSKRVPARVEQLDVVAQLALALRRRSARSTSRIVERSTTVDRRAALRRAPRARRAARVALRGRRRRGTSARADRPVHRRGGDAEHALDLVEQLERIAAPGDRAC